MLSRITLFFCLAFTVIAARADEGMWLPMLLKQLNEGAMQARGCKLTAEEIYAVNTSSLKDAIVALNGGGCTAEIIGRNGLLLTNHHCAYGQIQSHSAVGRNLLKEGFWAMKPADELPNPGTTASILVRMEDVTDKVVAAIAAGAPKDERGREELAAAAGKALAAQAVAGTPYSAQVKPFFYGAAYYMMVYNVYRDVRLVGAPPEGIGQFGGEADNWMWPRHQGDFSLFRIYTAPGGAAADYAEANVPLQPKRFLKINLAGTQPGDFTMVMGFPGRTQEYLTSYGVENIARHSDPYKVALRARRLAVLDAHMKLREELYIKHAAKYASIANYWKKWDGEMRGLKRLHIADKKRAQEAALATWIAAEPARQASYGKLLPDLKAVYDQLNALQLPVDYYREAVLAVEVFALAATLEPVREAIENNGDVAKALAGFTAGLPGFFKNYDEDTDRDIARVCMDAYLENLPQEEIPIYYQPNKNAFGAGEHNLEFVDKIYAKTRLTKQAGAEDLARDIKERGMKALNRDPAWAAYNHFARDYRTRLQPAYQAAQARLEPLMRTLVQAERAMEPQRLFYPDANSTLRVAYGQVQPYQPADGVRYTTQTYLDGAIAKRDTTIDEFALPARAVRLYNAKDYGPYADATGRLPLAFIATNHTTGGNSGSPVLNARGELIGTNFDRCWEGTMSDLAYDPALCRNIALDARFTLWVIDKYAGAGYLLNEMELVR